LYYKGIFSLYKQLTWNSKPTKHVKKYECLEFQAYKKSINLFTLEFQVYKKGMNSFILEFQAYKKAMNSFILEL
jgi:hypothetical protein